MTTLTQQQIDRIFEFTSQKYIKYYDVQLELVDHIASSIEQMMADDTNLQFEPALQKVYESFGVFGFTKVESDMGKQMTRYWTKMTMQSLKKYLQLPMLALTAIIAVTIWQLLTHFGLIGFFSLAIFLLIAQAALIWPQGRINTKRRRFLLLDSMLVISSFNWFLILWTIQFVLFNSLEGLGKVEVYTLCPLLTIAAIFTMVFAFDLPRILKIELENKYAHLNLAI